MVYIFTYTSNGDLFGCSSCGMVAVIACRWVSGSNRSIVSLLAYPARDSDIRISNPDHLSHVFNLNDNRLFFFLNTYICNIYISLHPFQT